VLVEVVRGGKKRRDTLTSAGPTELLPSAVTALLMAAVSGGPVMPERVKREE